MKRFAIAALALLAATPLTACAQTTRGPVYQQPLSAHSVMRVQERLREFGYYPGPIDGIWGRGTIVAVERFQASRRLAATGELNNATVSALGLDPDRLLAGRYAPPPTPPPEVVVPRIGPRTARAVQEQLQRVGLYRGPIDGVWGVNTRRALAEFQRERGFPATGEPSRDTLIALGLRPEYFMSGSSLPPDRADRLNREELERAERGGRY